MKRAKTFLTILGVMLALLAGTSLLAGCSKEFTVTVSGGSASAAKAAEGTEITLTLDYAEIPMGRAFHHWELDGETLEGDTFTMPARDVTVRAVYDGEYDVAVTGGHATKPKAAYKEMVQLVVDLDSIPEGMEFDMWVPSDSSVAVYGHYFNMPAKDISFRAAYREIKQAAYKINFLSNIDKDKIIHNAYVPANTLPSRPIEIEMPKHAISGWYRDEKYTLPFDFDNPVNADMTLFPKWTITVYEDESGTFTYGLNNKEAIITGLTEKGMEANALVVPEKVNGYKVGVIGSYALKDSAATSVMLPPTVYRIGDYAFAYSATEMVGLPSSLREIGYYAFFRSALIELQLPEGLTMINDRAFAFCASLESVTLPDSLKALRSNIFEQCASLKTVDFGEGLQSIGYGAFSKSGLESVTVPANVKNIDTNAFYTCISLKEAVIEGAQRLGDNAFNGCVSLTSAILPDSLETIGKYAFAACSSLKEIGIPAGVSHIDAGAFRTIPQNAKVVFGSAQPCKLASDVFIGQSLIVPEGSLAAYVAAWPQYRENIAEQSAVAALTDGRRG